MIQNPPGPTLLGFDVYLIGSILLGIAAAAVMLAIYAAVTVRDPMAKRVKALNERREQLKAGIVTASARKPGTPASVTVAPPTRPRRSTTATRLPASLR